MNLLTHLAIEAQKITKDEVILSMNLADFHKQPYGVMHGGISGVLIETACSMGANTALDTTKKHAVGLDLSVSHLKAVSSGTLTVTAIPDRIGRTIQVWQATIHTDLQEKIAVGRCTLSVVSHETT